QVELVTSFQLARAGQVTTTSVLAPRQLPKDSCALTLSPGMKTPLAQPRPERFAIDTVSAFAAPVAVGPAMRPAAISTEVARAGSFFSTAWPFGRGQSSYGGR